MSAAIASATHPNPDQIICVFVDVSLDFIGGIIAQVLHDLLELPVDQEDHTPLFFHSKALVLHLTLRTPEFCLLVDHANFIYLFDPKSQALSLPRHTCDKVLR
ncbi:hypothetical protein SDRG_05824 [Saprolegnia diclina VS20]|uniref:Reverse transcriptase RNase H-like domain-containing protein n=1 Tax=Saprolegnia diclina (strain VS20) TaxID=1156394 RepID=T0S2Y4_SAPDV|nr:hypothetical protein SDRG_05824 [Saprolegnia diclina VS20]EQC37007.1 hypothetical protein SDRG_05824 [Saprolegnia diclina VS20]|eukprot:XP_008609788.1 hypothetical protein SDRG_05824 [Saprolegnia diclina VS20]